MCARHIQRTDIVHVYSLYWRVQSCIAKLLVHSERVYALQTVQRNRYKMSVARCALDKCTRQLQICTDEYEHLENSIIVLVGW